MKRHLFRFWKRRKPIRRPIVRTPLALEPLETRLLFSVNVLSFEGYGAGSAGVNNQETLLTPVNVSSGDFGKLFSTPLDGQVYAQPLVDNSVIISNGPYTTPGLAGVHNVVFVATENDTVYAIDADPSSNGQILWQRNFTDVNDPNDALPGATTVTAIPAGDVGSLDLTPEIGITETPVIDPSTNILYVITATKQTVDDSAHYVQQLHAINISDGTDAATSYLIGDTTNGNDNNTPIYVYENGSGAGAVTDPYNGTGKPVVQFNAMWSFDRAALSLVNGSVYAAFSSHDDTGIYHGWVISWNVSNLSTSGFQLTGVLNDDPNNGDGGIWQAGAPLAFEPDGSAFFVGVGNGDLGTPPDIGVNGFPSDGNYPQSILKVAPDSSITEQNMSLNGWGFQIVDYFMPYNVMDLNANDKDISGGPVVLPASAGIPGHSNLVVAGAKNGKIYLIDGNNMGKYDPNNDNVLNAAPNGSGNNTPPVEMSALISTPAYFNGELYVVGAYSDYLKAFTINSDGSLSMVSNSSETFGYEPGSPVISADGTSNGILWIANRKTNELQAYDPNNLGDLLWSSGQGANALGLATKFAPPVVANGMVFVGTSNGLVVYGLNTPTAVSQAPSLSATVMSGTSVNLSWQDSSQPPNIASSYSIEESTDGVNFTQVTTAAAEATSLMIGGLTPGTNYWFRISGLNAVGNSPYSNVVTATTFSTGSAQAPVAPTELSATPASGTAVQLSWTNGSTNQTGYFLDRAADAGFTQNLITEALPGGPSSFTDVAVGLTPGGTYYYRLRAVNSLGSSVNTPAVAVTIPMTPPPPSNAVITGVTTNAIALSWTDNAGAQATGYRIYRSTNGEPFFLVATLPSGSTNWRDTSVSPGTAYEYSIVTYNVSGSNGDAEAGASTNPAPPVNPLGAATNEGTSLLPSLFQFELDAFLLTTYLRLAFSGNGLGESEVLKTEILGLWSAIGSNPLIETPLGLYVLQQVFALG